VADSQEANDDRAGLDLLIRGFQVSRMLRLVADLRVADLVPLDEQVGIDAPGERVWCPVPAADPYA
jgi:hypothetical protein